MTSHESPYQINDKTFQQCTSLYNYSEVWNIIDFKRAVFKQIMVLNYLSRQPSTYDASSDIVKRINVTVK